MSETVSDVSVNVFVDTHACEAVKAAEYWKFPAVVESHTEMWLIVSDVPPFVHAAGEDVRLIDPADAALNVNALRVVSPAAAAVVPDAPGSAVCSFAACTAGAVNVVPALLPRSTFKKALAVLLALNPTVTTTPFLAGCRRR